MQSMKFIQNYNNEHTKFNFGTLIVVILYEFHTSQFAVHTLGWLSLDSLVKHCALNSMHRHFTDCDCIESTTEPNSVLIIHIILGLHLIFVTLLTIKLVLDNVF